MITTKCQKRLVLLLLGLHPRLDANPVKTDGSDIGVSIMGTIIQSKSADNVALIKDKDGVVVALKKGFSTSSQFEVLSINSKYLELQDPKGKIYWVYRDKFSITQSGGPATPPVQSAAASIVVREEGFERKDNIVKMTETYRDKIIRDDLSKILMQATAEPFLENGAIIGFLVTQIDPGSIFQKSGIVDGDIITRINDQELNSIANSVKLLQSLKGAKQIDVDLRREGQIQRIRVEIN